VNKGVLVAIGGIVCLSTAVHAVERVSAFHSDIRIAASGELVVTETIELPGAMREPQRGLVRELAEDYRDRHGSRVKVPIAVEEVLRNGRPEPYAVERMANGARIRTGEPGRAIERGKQVYRIVYRTAREIAFLEEHDELYWDVGHGLDAAVERLSAEVSFERPVPASSLKVEANTGARGALGQDYHAFVRDSSAAFRATRPLTPREGMAILVSFPKGAVERPSHLARGSWYLDTNRGVPVGMTIFALMLGVLFACRMRLARTPLPTPRAAPPEGVGAGGVRFIDRGRYDERCLSAAILGLQSRGYLSVQEHGERLKLERGGNDVEWLPGEQSLARRLLRGPVEIRRHGRTLEEAGRRLAVELREAFGARRWAPHAPFAFAAGGIGVAGVLAMHALDTPPIAAALVAAAMAVALLVFAVKLMPILTPRGAEHREAIAALRQYLASADPASEEEFSRLLPYAVALELEDLWGRRFAECVPANLVVLTPRAADRAPERPTRPLRHKRSAAA
jgi:Predicted membrane protein (DUF2207) C-terminal domain/Predicted membrane protein (DUF2207) N-terminal domain